MTKFLRISNYFQEIQIINHLSFFSGTIIENNYNEFKVKTFKDGIFYGEKSLNITNKKFHDSITIEAGLFQFSFKLYSNKKHIEKLLFQVDNIVSGDAYIITGQSNSHGSSKKSTYISPFARSFGVKTGMKLTLRKMKWLDGV